jgi:transposase InsO family protein
LVFFFVKEDIKMPWKEFSKVESRRLFISAVESGRWRFSEVCRKFGISRKTGYKWLDRFRKEGDAGLFDRSRKPHLVRYATDPKIKNLLLAERKRYPVWGARKLCKVLEGKGIVPPPERTANRILKREGVTGMRKAAEDELIRFERPHPNDMWQADHKRAVLGKWGSRAFPLVVLDDCTRYCLGITSLPNVRFGPTWDALWHMFGEFGLPRSILTDNARIFRAFSGPSRFEVYLMRLGIKVLHGRPYHPQTQGKVERFNGTLERELLKDSCFGSPAELQAGFNRFRQAYNYERPHEALLMEVPGSVYRPSKRERPDELPHIEYPSGAELRKVQKDGWISYKNHIIEMGIGLSGEHVEVRETSYGVEIYYGLHRILGKRFDEQTKTRDDKVGGSRRRGTPLRATPFAPFPEQEKL